MISVRNRMTTPAITVRSDASPGETMKLLEERKISAVPVVDLAGDLTGVISTTDLVRGLANGADTSSIEGLMSAPAIVATPDEALDEAALRLVAAQIHRLVVVDGARPIGILSARDLLAEVKRRRLTTPIRSVMTSPAETIDIGASIEQAIDRLVTAGVHGLVVVDGATPVGVFTHAEALAARRFGRTLRNDPVEEIMSYETIVLDAETPAYRAAAHAVAMNVNRILVAEGKTRLVGVVGLVGLVRVLASAPADDGRVRASGP